MGCSCGQGADYFIIWHHFSYVALNRRTVLIKPDFIKTNDNKRRSINCPHISRVAVLRTVGVAVVVRLLTCVRVSVISISMMRVGLCRVRMTETWWVCCHCITEAGTQESATVSQHARITWQLYRPDLVTHQQSDNMETFLLSNVYNLLLPALYWPDFLLKTIHNISVRVCISHLNVITKFWPLTLHLCKLECVCSLRAPAVLRSIRKLDACFCSFTLRSCTFHFNVFTQTFFSFHFFMLFRHI